jgi:hypothetical protein
MNPGSFNNQTFTLADAAGAPVPGTVSYNPTLRQATFQPTNPLQAGTTYRATVTTGARDQTGSALSAAHTWTFTVA